MRVFIGIEFNSAIKDYLATVQQTVQTTAIKGNFTLYDNFHLTLKFIGEIHPNDLELLYVIMDEVADMHSTFEMKIGGLSSFVRKEKHIMYVDVQSGKDHLKKIVSSLEEQLLENHYIDKLDKYTPHITLGRQVMLSQASALDVLSYYDEPIKIGKIVLFLSERDSQGILRYTNIYESYLK